MFNYEISKTNKGSVVMIVLIFGIVFLIMIGGLFSFILFQMRASAQRLAWYQSLYVAESGVDYYKWCLNNQVQEDCSFNKEYFDIQGNSLGEFSLEVKETISCGELIDRSINAVGWVSNFPSTTRKIAVTYGRISVGKFAYLLNDSVWAGSDREIKGQYHSNGGIRMDGENQSIVSSSLKEWVCTSSFGCSPSSTEDGVFTTTNNSKTDLFQFPVPPFDFEGITIDLAEIKSKAGIDGTYLPPSVNIDSSADGYHLIFNNNGTVEVRIITRLYSDWAYSMEEDWHYDYFRIRNEYYYNTYTINNDCAVIFAEDNIWIEGEVDKKTTIASANLIEPNKDTNIVLIDDIDYVEKDGTDGFTAIAENNILISPSSPDQLEIRGIFVAQKGHFGRNHYPSNIRSKIEIVGSVVSNGRVGTQWTSGSTIVSGYLERENYIDTKLIYSPCPFVPYAEYDFKVINWEEIE
ncbi:hypothetical protein KKA24_00380 [Patescibacteria group bacterium]|nr:hypothetical protein [Patescibacteria group bacterium]